MDDDVISINSDDSNNEPQLNERRAILEPAIRSVVDALGGYEGGVYRMGDEALGCLKDLKKFWRKDDTDDDRTVARILWSTRALPNDLVPILLETAGKGHLEDKRAVACVDLITAMTWPIDLAEELKELDDEADRRADYTVLVQSHLHYKAALLRPGVLQALFQVMIMLLTKEKKVRTERDIQIMSVILHLIRNLAFIRDMPPNIHASVEQAEFSNLQNKLIRALSDTHFFDMILMLASGAVTDAMYNGWNTLVLDIFFLLFRGIKPDTLVLEQTLQSQRNLQQLLNIEEKRRRDFNRGAPTRHSRFGTTISVTLNPKKQVRPRADGEDEPAPAAGPSRNLVMHRQSAIGKDVGVMIDMGKKIKKSKTKADELFREQHLSLESRKILQSFAQGFIESCFNPFLTSLLKDIKSERPKITERDNVRLLFVAKWFLEFFLACRARQLREGLSAADGTLWDFGLVGTVVERSWIVWVLRRMAGAIEDKPKLWTELEAGMECLTQLLGLIETLASERADSELRSAAELLLGQLVYNGQVLDAAFDGLRTYKDGTQSLAFLSAGVNLAYSLMHMLEKWKKVRGDGTYVRKRKARRRQRAKGGEDGDAVPEYEDVTEAVEEETVEESIFTFEAFEMKFANSDVTHALITYLARYAEFPNDDCMKRVVSLMHRQAVRVKAEGLFFQVSTLDLFQEILSRRKQLPSTQPYKDLVALLTYISRQFFKTVQEDTFVLVEAFFPTNRGRWKRHSSWIPEEKEKGISGKGAVDARFPQDVIVKKGYSWSEQVAIAMAALQDAGEEALIEWTKDILSVVISQRTRIIEEIDGPRETPQEGEDLDDEELRARLLKKGPSTDAAAQITDYLIPYINDDQAQAATRNPNLKLLLRLVHCYVQDEDADELDWYIPAGISVPELQTVLNVITQFQENPLDLKGQKPSQLLQKKRRRRVRAPAASDGSGSDSDADLRAARRKKRKKEEKAYKSAEFVVDSDDEEDDAAFFAREAALRERTARIAAESGHAMASGTMRKTGTKKRKGRSVREGARKRHRAGGGLLDGSSDVEADPMAAGLDDEPVSFAPDADAILNDGSDSDADSDAAGGAQLPPQKRPQPRPRPVPRRKGRSGSPGELSSGSGAGADREAAHTAVSPVSAAISPVGYKGGADEGGDRDSDDAVPVRRRVVRRAIIDDDDADE
ncbi:timeless-domain-containing protein [Peniophora sp. CONT]|nr:timeless-domain-containing protein [Peniophora sp. CONT]